MTFFNDLKIGDKFKLPGGVEVFTKTSKSTAVDKTGRAVLADPVAHVVPERGATVDDILNSWRKL